MTVSKFYPAFATDFDRLLQRLAGRKVAVIGHARPDGDCIGSQVGLARMLASAGHDVTCVNADAVPRRLEFLVPGMKFLRTDDVLADPTDYAAVFVDCADQARVGERLKVRFPRPLANLDHHISNTHFAELNLVDAGSAATCEILTGLALDRGLALDAPAAQALFAGIVTDTGQFRFASTSRRTFLLAAELMAAGANPPQVGLELYERESMAKLELLQRYLSSLRMECGGRVCIGILPAGVFEATGSSAEDTEGLVDYARSVEGVDVGVLIKERTDGSVKASLRAKDATYRLDLIAAQFNGGGHASAAGLSLTSGTEDFYARLVAALAKQITLVDAAGKAAP
ncbi:MAG: phosphoesterase RecJ domain-containing protein [Verrucomicrobia bacterium]|jgi:bifunctional oligoribonuclease and PAP phosphatase NrnA|nr:MAG: phosphoesterase RecJ domain-containing protein [Verrucomicrobiota bacterium]